MCLSSIEPLELRHSACQQVKMTLGGLRHGIALQGQPDGDVVLLEGADHVLLQLGPRLNMIENRI